jgi:hypothetical protein
MTPERWQQIDKILELALELASSQRGVFLDQACAGDEELRREVESLLEVNIRADGFWENPPWNKWPEISPAINLLHWSDGSSRTTRFCVFSARGNGRCLVHGRFGHAVD